MQPGAAVEFLEQFAETAPKAYLQRQPSGQSLLRELYAHAAEAGLVPAGAGGDDIARLHALFDVALDHGMGGLVRDYVAEVCSDRLLTSSDPVEAFLLDGECVRRWVQKLLAVSRSRLASWLARGLASLSSAGLLPKELARLRMLQLVAEDLQPQGGAPQQAQHAQQAQQAAEPAEVTEARRLVQCAQVLTWLAGQQGGFERPTGRFFSEQEWRSVAAKRRDGAAAAAGGAGLFLADLAADLAALGCDGIAYPPPSPDRLLSTLFLSGAAGGSAASPAGKAGAGAAGSSSSSGGSEAAFRAKLALLAYYLADGGFMQPGAIVQGLQSQFHIPPATAHAWLLQQLLDDAQTADPSGAAALQRAADLAPLADAAPLPYKVVLAFMTRGKLDVALTLLRQRPETPVSLEEASVVLAVRLRNGLLGEAFLGIRRHLAAIAAAAPSPATAVQEQARAAEVLVGQLLQHAALSRPTCVYAAVRMPFGAAEEQAAVAWLEVQAAGGTIEAALMLPIYYLLRGRTPEALHAYARFCPRTPATQAQQELAALLTEAARLLPAPQRALIVQQGAAPALLPAEGGDGEEAAGVALIGGSIPDVTAEGAAARPLVAVGPTAAEAPLVGSIPVLLEQQRLAVAADQTASDGEAAAGGAGGGGAAAAQKGSAQQAQPMLFSAPAAGHCSNPACGDSVFHTPCVVEHLEKTLRASKGSAFGSKAWASVQVKLRQRPHAMFASSREQKMPQRCPCCKEGYIESAEPVKPEAARKLTPMPPPPDPLPLSPRAPRAAAGPAARPAAVPGQRPMQAAAPPAKKAAAAPQQGRVAGNGGGGHASNGCGGGMGRSRSGGGSGWGGTKQYVLRPLPPPTTNAWAAGSAGVAATAASLADADRQEADKAARLRADAQAREEAFLALSCDALDAMRAHKRHQAAATLVEMGYEYDAAAAAAEAAGGSTELAAHLLMGGALSSAHVGPICVTDEARELLDLGARLGLPPTEVEEALMDAEGDWRQAAAVLSSAAAVQREAVAAAAVAPRHRGAAAGGPSTATKGDNYGWGEWAEEPAQPAVLPRAAAATAVEGDNYGWGPGPQDYAHATQAAAIEEGVWEAVPPGSEWDTSPRPPDAQPAAPQQGSYSGGRAVDSYGWLIEQEQPPPAAQAVAHGDYSVGGGWGGQGLQSATMGARAGNTQLGSPGSSSSAPACGLCACAINESEERCLGTCEAGCRCSFHLPCVVKAVEQAVRANMAASRQRKFGEVMLSKITKRPAEAVKEWLRRHPPPLCPACNVAPLVAAHVHKPAAAKSARNTAAAWAPATAAVRSLPQAGSRSAGRVAAAAPNGASHPWLGSTQSRRVPPAPPPARMSSFAAEQERQAAEQQAREAILRQAAAARKQEKAAQAAAQQAAQKLATAAAAQQAVLAQAQVQPSETAAVTVQQEGAVLLSEAALDLMRGHKRRDCARSLRDMGFGVRECLAATVAWGGELEPSAAALLEGRAAPSGIATCVAREARQLVEAGSRLGLAAAAVEAVLVALDGDWEQAQRQLKHQVEAASAAASAATLHAPSSRSLGSAVAGAVALSRCSSSGTAVGLTPAQAIYSYEGAYLGSGGGWEAMAADNVASGQYASLEAQASTTAAGWTAPGAQLEDAATLWAAPAAASAAADPQQFWPGVAAEDSACGWAGSLDGSTAGKAPGNWPAQPSGEQQQSDEAEVADLMCLLGLSS
ncbi:E3 ubiquitin- ligase HOS1 [Chlorella sorokiniana]|uniref:E3 ubiquitin-ligase HOS1 n=1 Tax=Chlorella sorokiniana TaxID=3076 RepID=A0A2P6TZ92_CHLSO|nr:E3 ubiquitin- ligase HOS1 [Chlorella sorokiniana]|eukprot:PRW59389.1 E3 ubiquitin- ligase HOS1 [Chlorella sorokiniana]